MPATMQFELNHAELAKPVDIKIEIPGVPETMTSYFETVRSGWEKARVSVAAMVVDRSKFATQGDYDTELKRVGKGVVVEGFLILGKTKRYSVEGTYSDGGGTWADWTEGLNEVDAEFAGRWMMAENQGASLDRFDSFLETMEGISIDICSPEPVTKDEYVASLKALVEEAIAAGHTGTALDEAMERLRSDGHEIEASQGMRP